MSKSSVAAAVLAVSFSYLNVSCMGPVFIKAPAAVTPSVAAATAATPAAAASASAAPGVKTPAAAQTPVLASTAGTGAASTASAAPAAPPAAAQTASPAPTSMAAMIAPLNGANAFIGLAAGMFFVMVLSLFIFRGKAPKPQ